MPNPPGPSANITFNPNSITGGAFAGSGLGDYSALGISATQAGLPVQVQGSSTSNAGGMANARGDTTSIDTTTVSVSTLLANFRSVVMTDPAQASAIGQELYDAGFMTDAVYNSGQINGSDLYNAYKNAVLSAQSAGRPLGDYIIQRQTSFQAAGGPKIRLPNVRYVATLTPTADVQAAGDAVFEKILGRRMTPAELAAIHSALNTQELTARSQEAQSAYSELLAYRGLSTTGQPPNPSAPANAQQPSGGPSPQQGPTVGGPANLPQQVTNQSGGTSTVSSGPIVTPYNQAPNPSAAAYSYAMTNDQPEVQGRTIAAAMQAIADFVGRK